jgi:germination protein M
MQRIALTLTTLALLVACAEPATVTDAGPITAPPATGQPEAPTTTSSAPTSETSAPVGQTTAPAGETTSTTSPPPAQEEMIGLKAYFLLDDQGAPSHRPGPFLVPVHREVPKTVAVATAAMNQLLEGPSADEHAGTPAMSSAIPEGTVLLGIKIEDGLATVDLSREFESGGGSFSMTARLAQVVYTVSQFPTVERVAFHLDGQPVEVFSGEGLVLDEPVSRDDYLDLLPLIFVDQPAWGAPAGNPARVQGIGAVFEATFHLALYDGDGRVLAEPPFAMTDNGTGWGRFDVSLPYSVDREQLGSLVVWDFSAEDGSRQNIREYPVQLSD